MVSRIGQVGLEVDGLEIDVLVEIWLVRKLEILPELCRVEKLVHSG